MFYDQSQVKQLYAEEKAVQKKREHKKSLLPASNSLKCVLLKSES
jgi:hypothetical protein